MRVLAAALVAIVVLLPGLDAHASQAELDRARREANRAAGDLAASQSRLAELEQQVAALTAEQEANAARLSTLQASVREFAVAQYLRGGKAVDLDLEIDVSKTVRANALARIVASGSEGAVDEYRAAAEDFELSAARLSAAEREAKEAVDAMRQRIAAATARLQRLEQLEAERIAREKAERERQERAAAAARQAAARQTAARPRAATPARSRAAPAPAGAPRSGSWICPVQGPRAFTNDWGQPRSGGRRHQGTDILSPRGTPVVAPVAGVARGHNSRLGGISFYLNGVDGTTYFGTHLDSLSGASGRVAAGTVLGYVGDSGNARGGPTHLHFEIHPGGGGPVNPYPTLRQHC